MAVQTAAKQGHTKKPTNSVHVSRRYEGKYLLPFTYLNSFQFNIVYRIKIIVMPLKGFQDLVDNEIYAYIFFIGCFSSP
jgi:hypothetical protein